MPRRKQIHLVPIRDTPTTGLTEDDMDYSFYLTTYDPAWKSKFEAEKSQLQAVFGAAALEIEHR
jgi:GrpB-like predicted nucleotidyltransferase (UPF0157 family)